MISVVHRPWTADLFPDAEVLEDVLEQIFGEIGDEHDIRRPRTAPDGAVIEVDAGSKIRDLASQYGIELPGDAGFETLAGFLLFKLGRIPTPGDAVTHDDIQFCVGPGYPDDIDPELDIRDRLAPCPTESPAA